MKGARRALTMVSDNCETSDEEGLVQLDAPANSELTLELTAEGFGPTLLPVTTTDTGPAPQLGPLLDEATLGLLAGVLGIDYPFVGTGVMAVSVLEELTLGGTASNCVIVMGWPGSTESSLRFPVQPGFVTQTVVTCDPVE